MVFPVLRNEPSGALRLSSTPSFGPFPTPVLDARAPRFVPCASSIVLASRSRLSCRSRLSSCSSVWRFSFSSLSCSTLSVASRVASSSAAFSGRSSRRLAFSSRKRAFSTWARCSSNRKLSICTRRVSTPDICVYSSRTNWPMIRRFTRLNAMRSQTITSRTSPQM